MGTLLHSLKHDNGTNNTFYTIGSDGLTADSNWSDWVEEIKYAATVFLWEKAKEPFEEKIEDLTPVNQEVERLQKRIRQHINSFLRNYAIDKMDAPIGEGQNAFRAAVDQINKMLNEKRSALKEKTGTMQALIKTCANAINPINAAKQRLIHQHNNDVKIKTEIKKRLSAEEELKQLKSQHYDVYLSAEREPDMGKFKDSSIVLFWEQASADSVAIAVETGQALVKPKDGPVFRLSLDQLGQAFESICHSLLPLPKPGDGLREFKTSPDAEIVVACVKAYLAKHRPQASRANASGFFQSSKKSYADQEPGPSNDPTEDRPDQTQAPGQHYA